MRNGVFWLLSFVSISFSAMATEYNVPTDGTVAAATTAANANGSSGPFVINISGNNTNTGSTTNLIKRSVVINGIGNGATITGDLRFTGGTSIISTIDDLTFTGSPKVALINGIGGSTSAGHTITLNNIIFDANVNTSNIQGNAGAISNYGNIIINSGTFTNNSAAAGGGAIINNYGRLNITNSSFEHNSAVNNYGGAIALTNSLENNTITNTSFNSNTATNSGGAIFLVDSSNLTLDGVEFKNNVATSKMGGGIYSNTAMEHTLTIKNGSVFDGNTAATGGGAIMQEAGGQLFITAATFSNNTTTTGNGGGINLIGAADISNTSFINNRAGGIGGGVHSSGTNVRINNVLFDGNTAGTDGGAIRHRNGGAISITGTTIRNNTATTGNGGGAIVGGGVNISNTSFINNHADAKYGGGLYSSGMDSRLDAVTFDGNTATMGGGIIHWAYTVTGGVPTGGVMTIGGNSVFRNNTATQGGAIFNLATVNLDTTNGNIVFENNSAQEGADIYNNTSSPLYGMVNIIGDSNALSIGGGIAGGDLTTVNKTGANEFIITETADNTDFSGTFTQSAGKTTVYADNFFAGANNIKNGSTLHFASSADVNNLNLTTSAVLDIRHKDNPLSKAAFSPNTLNIANLSSDDSAGVMMQTDGTVSDLIKITGTSAGDYMLHFNAIGANPTNDKILVVDLTGATTKGAEFASDGVDVGAWKYGLFKEADENWYLERTDELGTDAQHVAAVPALHLSLVNTGLNELRKRLGALRNNNQNEQNTGVWVRSYAKNMHLHEISNATMNLYGVEGGIDGMLHAWNGKLYLGVMAGTIETHNIKVKDSLGVRGYGHGDTPSVGLYAAWVENNKGKSNWFVDMTLRHFWAHTDIERNDGSNGYDVRRNFYAASAEVGRLFYLESPSFMNIGTKQHSHVSIEPKFELRYKYGDGHKFELDNGVNGSVDATESYSTHFNIQFNYLPNGTASTWKPFVELGVYNEFSGDTDMIFAGDKVEVSDTSGMGFESTIGTNAAINENLYAYGALTAEVGEVYTSYQANLGVRIKF